MRKAKFLYAGVFLVLLAGAAFWLSTKNQPVPTQRHISSEADFYSQNIQPIFNARCIACHACLQSPCQFNLQSYEGAIRGGNHILVYNGSRSKEIAPTRMFEDALSTQEWRDRGFYNVVGTPGRSILQAVLDAAQKSNPRPKVPVEESHVCSDDPESILQPAEHAMPYGLPPLEPRQTEMIRRWIADGAPGPQRSALARDFKVSVREEAHDWESFFNQKDLKSRIVARYMYEHLFLAHLYFQNDPQKFYRLVRSRTNCNEGVDLIRTRTPNEDPGVAEFSYCLVNEQSTIVLKNHIPYMLASDRLKYIKKLFLSSNWTATALPSYKPELASNPFLTFKDIPVEARYRFLLMDSRYHIMTFIKGPVCNGTMAVNSIQEQFYVFFTDPKKDLMASNPDFNAQVSPNLNLPGLAGSTVTLSNVLGVYKNLVDQRNQYREIKYKYLENQNDFLDLKSIWDGDGSNRNAVLTVFRHNESAEVSYGPVGDISKTAFLLDYSLFERLVYNLVVNFDVYGNLGHQLLSRVYMDLIRMESEDNFLNLLPLKDRLAVKKSWYKGLLTSIQLSVLEEKSFLRKETAISYEPGIDKKTALIQKILTRRLSSKIYSQDSVNWKKIGIKVEPLENINYRMRSIASVNTMEKPFPIYFPEFSVLLVIGKNQKNHVFSLIKNREHKNIAWLMNDKGREAPEEMSLTVLESVRGSYPNLFFAVKEEELDAWTQAVLNIKSDANYKEVLSRWAVDRLNPEFWSVYDGIDARFTEENPVEAGKLDLSRYQLAL